MSRWTLPQLVPKSACDACRLCCHFAEPDATWTPHFFADEAARAIARGVPDTAFARLDASRGASIEPVRGEGCLLCPAYAAATNTCTLGPDKPLDCQLYPFVITYSEDRRRVLLALDRQCPFPRDHVDQLARAAYVSRLTAILEGPDVLDTLERDPGIIDNFQPSFVPVAELPGVTRRAFGPAPELGLTKLTAETARALSPPSRRWSRRAGAHPATLLIWSDLLQVFTAPLGHGTVILASQGGAWFLPQPPLGMALDASTLEAAFALLDRLNQGGSASRIEQIPGPARTRVAAAGYRLAPSHREYLYRRDRLALLAGGALKSQRTACHQFERFHPRASVRPFVPADQPAALTLYRRWARIRAAREKETQPDAWPRLLREDAFRAHRRAMLSQEPAGLSGAVLEDEGELLGYAFTMPLDPETTGVLLEVTDPAVRGAGAWFSQALAQALAPARWLNWMGDDDLPGLRAAKLHYRPAVILTGWTATRPNP